MPVIESPPRLTSNHHQSWFPVPVPQFSTARGNREPPPSVVHIHNSSIILRGCGAINYRVASHNQKKYVALQEALDEVGRMLGGWIKSLKQK